MSNSLSWEEFGQKLDTEYRSAKKGLWQTISCLHGKQTPVAALIKDANDVLLKHQKGIINHWREYFCELLNLVTVQHSETSKKQIGKEIHLTKAKVNTGIKSLKPGKAPGKDNIRPKILKAMNNLSSVFEGTNICKQFFSKLNITKKLLQIKADR